MNSTFWIIIAILVTIAIVAFFLLTRRKGGKQESKMTIDTHWVSVGMSVSSSPDAGVVVEKAKSEAGGLTAEDKSGCGVRATAIAAQKDIKLTNSAPPGDDIPKT